VVAKLGAGSAVLHENDVEAINWMSALRATRESMQERPSVPPGASCSIDADGVATVLDPGSRRKFVLEPIANIAGATATLAPANESAAAPQVAAQPQRFPDVSRARDSAAQAAADVAARPERMQAPRVEPQAIAASHGQGGGGGGATKKKRFDTIGFSDARLGPGRVQVVGGAASTAPAANAGGKPLDGSTAQSTPGGTLPRASVAERAESVSVRASGKPRAELELLLERDEEPSASNPLSYRERAYLLTRGTTISEAEAALRWKLAELQRALESTPRGRFVNLAVFDHRWSQVPERPPVIALQWRDWRGEVAVDYPAATRLSSLPPPTRPHDDHLPEVFEALAELTRLHTAAEGLDFAVRLLARVIPSEATSACLYDINTDELRFVAAAGTGADGMRGRAVPRAAGLFGRALRAETTASVFADVMVEPAFDPQVDSRPGLDARNMLLRPLVHDRQLMGMLQLVNRTGAGTFSAEDIHAVNYAAERLAEFLHTARMKRRAQP
jgi:hypothetical protein